MKRRPPYRKRAHRTPEKNQRSFKIRPGADPALKRVFATIGAPPQSEFKPDSFQIKAVKACAETDCLVTAPTGAGKTWIAEQAIERMLKQGKRSWYACPLKALSNAKYQEFSKLFGAANTGILTGDRKENPDASIIVGTTEILRNQLYDAMHRGEMFLTDLVVLDEAHFLGDPDRGVVWEEIMIYLPARIPLLMLSATIGNAHQIAGWLTGIRSTKCRIIEETQRPVPLFHLFLHPSGTLLPLLGNDRHNGRTQISKRVRVYLDAKPPPRLGSPRKLPPFGKILQVLRKYRLLPAIVFLKSRADCDNAVELCTENLVTNSDRKQKLSQRIHELIADGAYTSHHRQIWSLEHLAVGAHHSGQLPSWKLILEKLMTEGCLDAIFATSTVAAGVNFPARTILFLNSDRYNGTQFLPLSSTEFHQMTGRAGRRGKDRIGFALSIPGRFMDVRLMAKLVTAPPTDVLSQIRINFSMVLNLLLSHSPDQIEGLLENSFATFLITTGKLKGNRKKHPSQGLKLLWQDFLKHLHFLKETGYVDHNDKLTRDGLWTSQLRVDQPLMIAEGFRKGSFPESDPALFAAIISLFVNEDESDYRVDREQLSSTLFRTIQQVGKELEPFAKRMTSRGFAVRALLPRPAIAIFSWATGQPWEKILSMVDIAEGNLAMLILRTADNLRHIRSLQQVFPEAAETATVALDLLLRDPVVVA